MTQDYTHLNNGDLCEQLRQSVNQSPEYRDLRHEMQRRGYDNLEWFGLTTANGYGRYATRALYLASLLPEEELLAMLARNQRDETPTT